MIAAAIATRNTTPRGADHNKCDPEAPDQITGEDHTSVAAPADATMHLVTATRYPSFATLLFTRTSGVERSSLADNKIALWHGLAAMRKSHCFSKSLECHAGPCTTGASSRRIRSVAFGFGSSLARSRRFIHAGSALLLARTIRSRNHFANSASSAIPAARASIVRIASAGSNVNV